MHRRTVHKKIMTAKPSARAMAIDLIGVENVKKLEAEGLMIVTEQEWVRQVLVDEMEGR